MNEFFKNNSILSFLNLHSELDDFSEIHEKIEKDVIFKGTNLYILIFAIIIASVGLNVNSTAVIIGAMLISPLMGPINGMGYGLATFNFTLFRKSIYNFAFAVIISLITSTVYFSISPISTAYSEILARTTPTIFDVLIALFGGLAGIVAISSKQKGNVIPGVAIATALMPPLCTAGYGLATRQFDFFFGAFFLFTINTVFIALSSILVSQLLKFPISNFVEEKQKIKVTRWISVISAMVIIPSIYFGYLLVQRETFKNNAQNFINEISVNEGNYLLKHTIEPKTKLVELVYGGADVSIEQKAIITKKLKTYNIANAKLVFKQGLSFDVISKSNSTIDIQKAQINKLNAAITNNKRYIDSLETVKFTGKQLLKEIKPIFPEITGCTFADSYYFYSDSTKAYPQNIVIMRTNSRLPNSVKDKLQSWIQARMNIKNVRIYYE